MIITTDVVTAVVSSGLTLLGMVPVFRKFVVKAELASKTDAVKNSELGRVAAGALHAYEKGFDALTPNEKGTLVTLVRVELAKAHVDVNDADIVSALNAAQNLADGFKNTEAYKALSRWNNR